MINEGFVWQDTLDYFGEPGSEVDWQHFCQGVPSSGVVDANSNEVIREYKLRYGYEYRVMWKQTTPLPVPTWSCAAFDVIEAPTE